MATERSSRLFSGHVPSQRTAYGRGDWAAAGGAARLTAVVPYIAYARKDRRTKPRDPVTSRYVAQLLEAIG
ncbi:ribose-phosphate pyrophosphokinase-like domain-containing protein [Neoroseomonas lacus]|uniref:ribose-phosphate pyrophosphokinase-like domain-containing protein n=1 Tax=Neoroseomonas lacus TaxID=287609 RepID=UPI00227D4B95|nr:ribose-phosphate pyrophosphokinase-like domain-containing protein [Neoroseomonas lacus]